jgi:hypothetical protein
MKQSKELFINSVRQIRIRGDTIIPTVVLYKGGKSYAGIDALENCEEASGLREDFKIEIGNDDPIKLAQKQIGTGTSSRRSILGIAKDFFDYVIGQGLAAIELQGFQLPTRVLIAEPLALSNSQVAQ